MSGLHHLAGFWDALEQSKALELVREIQEQAPLARPSTPGGKPMRVRITSAGARAWWSDPHGGYRYRTTQHGGQPLPRAPGWLLGEALRACEQCGVDAQWSPDAVLINWYDPDAFLSTHRDESEPDQTAPIVSFSLGDACTFKVRGLERETPVQCSITLESGDCFILSGESRRCYHEVTRIHEHLPIVSPLRVPGRISILIRKVT